MEPFCFEKGEISILCVEDDPDARSILRETIRDRFPHITLHLAENGIMGLDKFRKHSPHLTITDIRMPLMDGISMAREIRLIEPDARILVLTAHDDTSYLLDAIRIGISNYLLKPFDPDLFCEALNDCVGQIVMEREARKESKLLRNPAGIGPEDAAGLSPGILKAPGGENWELEAFCFRLAHDLRSPLNGINITCEALVMLFGDQLNEECKTFLDYIREEVRRMNKMIDGVLTFPDSPYRP